MNQRGQYGRQHRGSPRALVGISLYHSVGDRERALDQIGTGFRQLSTEVMAKAGYSADPYRDASGPLYDWWKFAGIPVLDEWQAFQTKQWDSWTARFMTSWEVYEGWQARLKNLRDAAAVKMRALGQSLETQASEQLLSTLPGAVLDATGEVAKEAGKLAKRGAEGAGAAASDLMKIVKYGGIAVLGLGAIVALSSVAQNLRSGTDPAEKYMELWRGRRRRA